MAGIKQIQQRRDSALSICRITRTMEMISTSRYKSYHDRWAAMVDYHDALARAGYLLVSSDKPVDHPLLRDNEAGRGAIMAIGSVRGLCGAYNNSVYRVVDAHIARAKDQGTNLEIHVPERKLLSNLRYHDVEPTQVYSDLGEIPSKIQLDELADSFVEQYMLGKLDYFSVVYMRYYSASSQQPQTLTLMPLTELIDDLTTRSTVIWPWDLSFEDFHLSPPASRFIEALARMLIRASMETCFLDAALSEHHARMMAMRSATDNAEEMIDNLTSQYNRQRQNNITAELLDIIGGTGML